MAGTFKRFADACSSLAWSLPPLRNVNVFLLFIFFIFFKVHDYVRKREIGGGHVRLCLIWNVGSISVSRVQAGVALQSFFAAEKDHETPLPPSGSRCVLLLLNASWPFRKVLLKYTQQNTPSFKKTHLQSIRTWLWSTDPGNEGLPVGFPENTPGRNIRRCSGKSQRNILKRPRDAQRMGQGLLKNQGDQLITSSRQDHLGL